MPTKSTPGATKTRLLPKIPKEISSIGKPVMERKYNAAVITDTASMTDEAPNKGAHAEVVVCSSFIKTADYLFRAYAEDYKDAFESSTLKAGQSPLSYNEFLEAMGNEVVRLEYQSGDFREYYVVKTPVF